MTTDRNLESLDGWLVEVRVTASLAPLVELARSLAAKIDEGVWNAAVADQYRQTLDRLAERIAEECEGAHHVDLALLLSEPTKGTR